MFDEDQKLTKKYYDETKFKEQNRNKNFKNLIHYLVEYSQFPAA